MHEDTSFRIFILFFFRFFRFFLIRLPSNSSSFHSSASPFRVMSLGVGTTVYQQLVRRVVGATGLLPAGVEAALSFAQMGEKKGKAVTGSNSSSNLKEENSVPQFVFSSSQACKLSGSDLSVERVTYLVEKEFNDSCSELGKADALPVTVSSQGPRLFLHAKWKDYIDRGVKEGGSSWTDFSFSPNESGGEIVVEFSSPNIGKPFHAGHLRSTIIGNVLANMYESAGWLVHRRNYLGDWGRQVGVVSYGYDKFGSAERFKKEGLKHLLDVYVQASREMENSDDARAAISLYCDKLESGDEDAIRVWQQFTTESISSYRHMYHRLNIKFSEYEFESTYAALVDQIVDLVRAKERKFGGKSILKVEDNGAIIVDLTANEENLSHSVLRKANGSSTYLSRDLGAILSRIGHSTVDKYLYVVANEQTLHFQQLMRVLGLIDANVAKRCEHIPFGFVEGLSSRRGNVVFLSDILDETKRRMLITIQESKNDQALSSEEMDFVADELALSSVLVQDLKAKRIKNYTFDWNRMLQTTGDTGVFLQYTHARLCSIERKSGLEPYNKKELVTWKDDVVQCTHAQKIAHLLLQKYNIRNDVLRTNDPSVFVQYLFYLSRTISSSLPHLRVKDEPDMELARQRLTLLCAARSTLHQGLAIIGLIPLERV
eukprot:m.55908 g.55908  ORF g.55908 m.55908 type:complete len:658 (+) comp7776_c0_seq3:1235-3208(+)